MVSCQPSLTARRFGANPQSGKCIMDMFFVRVLRQITSSNLLIPLCLGLAGSFTGAALSRGQGQSTSSIGLDDRHGRVEGLVLTQAGVPVINATVYAVELGRTPVATTDLEGKFILIGVTVGEHRIFAFKEADRFPDVF